MKILSIRQPWAWAIIHAGKDVENRSWPTKVRGRVLVHAGLKQTHDDWDDCMDFMDEWFPMPSEERLRRRARAINDHAAQRGGIVGSVEIVDCVSEHTSLWFAGPFGFVLRDPRPLRFMPLRGRLGFFDAPAELVARIGGEA